LTQTQHAADPKPQPAAPKQTPAQVPGKNTAMPSQVPQMRLPVMSVRPMPLEESLSEDFSIPDEENGDNNHGIPRVTNSQRLRQGASNRGDASSHHNPQLQVPGISQPSESQHQSRAESSSSFNIQNEYLMQQLILGRRRMQEASQMDDFAALGTQQDKDGNKKISDKGLHPFQLDQIIAYDFNKEKVKSEDPGKLECCICLVPYENGIRVKVLQCVHTFHAKCIDEWLVKKSICPECNFNLRSVDPRELV
jgi:hypothetical protein